MGLMKTDRLACQACCELGLKALVRFAAAHLVGENNLGLEFEFSSVSLVSASVKCRADNSPFFTRNERR